MERLRNYIDGEMVDPAGGAYLDNVDPAVGRLRSQVPRSGEDDLQRAVEAATAAFPLWSATPAQQRSRLLLDVADRIEEDLPAFARAECVDTGKPLSLASSLDIPRAVSNLRFFATAILHTRSESHSTDYQALNYIVIISKS